MTTKAELAGRLRAEEARMQRLQNACAEFHTKHKGTPAAFDFNSLKHAVAGRDPVLEEAAAALTEAGAGEAANLRQQIDDLANFIMAEVPGEPSQNEGAVECAIRWMRERLASPPPVQPVVKALTPSEFRKSRPDLDFADKKQHAAIGLAYALTAPPSPASGVTEIQLNEIMDALFGPFDLKTNYHTWVTPNREEFRNKLRDVLNAALQPAEQPDDMRTEEAEPVAWMDHMGGVITSEMKRQYELVGGRPTDYTIPLYASPPRMARGGILSTTRKMPRSSRLALLEAAVSDMEYLLRPALKAAEAEADRLRRGLVELRQHVALGARSSDIRRAIKVIDALLNKPGGE